MEVPMELMTELSKSMSGVFHPDSNKQTFSQKNLNRSVLPDVKRRRGSSRKYECFGGRLVG